jgi:hypothetical protein
VTAVLNTTAIFESSWFVAFKKESGASKITMATGKCRSSGWNFPTYNTQAGNTLRSTKQNMRRKACNTIIRFATIERCLDMKKVS